MDLVFGQEQTGWYVNGMVGGHDFHAVQTDEQTRGSIGGSDFQIKWYPHERTNPNIARIHGSSVGGKIEIQKTIIDLGMVNDTNFSAPVHRRLVDREARLFSTGANHFVKISVLPHPKQ